MIQTDDARAQRQTLGEQTLSITNEQLLEFIADKGIGSPCEACGSQHWYFAKDEAGPTISSSPNVRHPGTSSWFFFMSCHNCSNTRFLEAGRVWEHYFGPSKGGAE